VVLHRFSVLELKRGNLSTRHAHRVVVMQYYPRFLPKSSIDENIHALAPARDLFTEFKAKARECKDHNVAFESIHYEQRFQLSTEGLAHLERLCEISKEKDVFLICQCGPLERCHADLLLITAKLTFGAQTQRLRCRYLQYEARLKKESL